MHRDTGIVSAGRIEHKAKGTCTLCSITKYENVAIEVSVRNGGIGQVEQKRLRHLNTGQVRFFPDEDPMTCYEDKINRQETLGLHFILKYQIELKFVVEK